jgi:hypothetical protein
MRNRVPTTLTLPPELIERVDRLASADERSRSFVVARALQFFCDANENPGGEVMPPGPDSAPARMCDPAAPAACAPVSLRGTVQAAEPPSTDKVQAMLDTENRARATALGETNARHAAVLDRARMLARERAESERQQRDRVAAQNAENLSRLDRPYGDER